MPLTRNVALSKLSRYGNKTTTQNLDPYTYNPRYPGLDESNYKKMEEGVNSLGLQGYQKEQAMDEAYPQTLNIVQNQIKNSDRRQMINDAAYEVSQITDPSARAIAQGKLDVLQLTQLIKEKYNVDPTAPDQEVFDDFIQRVPNGEELLERYMTQGDRELLYAGGLAERTNTPTPRSTSVGGIQAVINKQAEIDSDSTLGKINKITDRANIIGRGTQWADNMIQKIPVLNYQEQVENLAKKMNNLSEDELARLYDNYVEMINNAKDGVDDRGWWELLRDGGVEGDKKARDLLNTLHLADYSEAMPQDGVERNQWGTQGWDKVTKGSDLEDINKEIDESNMPGLLKAGAKGAAWTADKVKNLLNFIGGSWGGLENYAEAAAVGEQKLDDIRNRRWYIPENMETNEDAFKAYVANRVANFGEYMTDAPDTLVGNPVTPNAVKFLSNIPTSFIKSLSAGIRGRTNPLDSKIGLAKMLFTEEGQQAMIDRYGSVENIANLINTDPAGFGDEVLAWADKFNSLVSGAAGTEKTNIGSVQDAISDISLRGGTIGDYNIPGLKQGLDNIGGWLNDKGWNKTAGLVDIARDASLDPNKLTQDVAREAGMIARDVVDTADTVKNFAKNPRQTLNDEVVEPLTTKLMKTKSGQDKLFQAQEPTLNRLSKERKTGQIRNKADVANELVVKDIKENGGELPTDVWTREAAHERAMKNIWSEIESKINDKKGVVVSASKIADALDAYINREEGYGITKNKPELEQLKQQSQDIRDMEWIEIPKLEGMKERINAEINDWDDKSVGNTWKNGMRELTSIMGKYEDEVIARLPGEFQDLKNDFGALADGYGDVVKARVKEERAKQSDGLSNYSRISGLGDIWKGIKNFDIGDLGKGAAKFVGGEVTAKMRDKNRLIEQGFKELSAEMDAPGFKSAKKNKAGRPKGESNVSSKTEKANRKTVKNLLNPPKNTQTK